MADFLVSRTLPSGDVPVEKQRRSRASLSERERGSHRRIGIAISILVYLGLALYAYWPASLLSTSQMVGGGVGDGAGQAAALAWLPFAISHHLNPFVTDYVNYPLGVNLATNAIAPVIGLLAWPVTATLGPIAAFTFAFTAGLFLSATAMFVVLLRFTQSVYPAFLGGLLYGFSDYTISEGLGHLAIFFVPLPPIIVYLVLELVGFQEKSARRTGMLLGIVLALQANISIEILADLALVVILMAAVVAVRYRGFSGGSRQTRCNWRRVGGWDFRCCCRVSDLGPDCGAAASDGAAATACPSGSLSLRSPRSNRSRGQQVLTPTRLSALGSSWISNDVSEYGFYIGAPLLVTVGVFAIIYRRNPLIRLALLGAVVSFVLSLGTRLTIAGHVYNIPLPFAAFAHLPLVADEVPGRYSLFMQLFVAMLATIGFDETWARLRQRGVKAQHLRGRFQTSKLLVPAVAMWVGAILVPLVPGFPYVQSPTMIPRYFTDSNVRAIPKGSVLLAYPYPQPPGDNQAQMWQAVTGYRFKIVGGYGIFRWPGGEGSPYAPVLDPAVVEALFNEALTNIAQLPGVEFGTAREDGFADVRCDPDLPEALSGRDDRCGSDWRESVACAQVPYSGPWSTDVPGRHVDLVSSATVALSDKPLAGLTIRRAASRLPTSWNRSWPDPR